MKRLPISNEKFRLKRKLDSLNGMREGDTHSRPVYG